MDARQKTFFSNLFFHLLEHMFKKSFKKVEKIAFFWLFFWKKLHFFWFFKAFFRKMLNHGRYTKRIFFKHFFFIWTRACSKKLRNFWNLHNFATKCSIMGAVQNNFFKCSLSFCREHLKKNKKQQKKSIFP